MKIYGFKLEEVSYPYYNAKAKEYKFALTYIDSILNEDTMSLIPSGVQGIIVTPADTINAKVLKYLKSKKVKYIVTSSAGFEHIDLKAAKKLGYKIGRVPAYSPTSVASWTLTAGLELLRKTNLMFAQSVKYDFRADETLLAKEFRELTIGIIGTGRIGYETANYFHSIGFKVLGYDLYQNEKAKEILTYVNLDTLLKESDLISLHINHVKGENDNFINSEFINKMKQGSVIINAARAPLVDLKAIQAGIKSNKLLGFATDVFENEGFILGEQLSEAQLNKLNPDLNNILKLYPRVLVSQHVAYFTTESVKNIAEVTMLNLKQLQDTGTCDTTLT